ncbi:MAG: DUF2779 domain-containing protein [Bacteroidetes bacterium]|nr:DUF2779 domain-containing protein [Bacteroidota bacterium]
MKKRSYNLSKSAFIKGLQCHKSLYLKKYHPELEDEISESQQAIFDKGTNIGILAQQLFPGGTDLGGYIPHNFLEVFKQTDQLILGEAPIYEAGFSYDNLLCFIDIMEKKNGKWHACEVKGSTSVKETYLWDTAFQYHVMISSGIELEDISVVYLNNQYVRNGELDLHELFTIESVKDQILPLLPKVKEYIKQMKGMLEDDTSPSISIGPQCSNPYPCSFMGHCWKDVPEYSIFNISRLSEDKKFDLYEKGIIKLSDIPDDYPLSSNQQLQVLAEKNGESIIDKTEINTFLNKLKYPLYFLDFETFQPSVPMFDQSRPFQQICFQYSLHILDKPNGKLIHKEFLAEAKDDPRLSFIRQLIQDIGKEGDIIVYNKGFETARLNEIGSDFPEYQNQTNEINQRVVDLMDPFSKKHYYTPEMKGSYSIKKVLPALVPELSYKNLNINEGGSASIAFESLYNETDEHKIKQTRDDLLAYCKLDTLAMVEILKVLYGNS